MTTINETVLISFAEFCRTALSDPLSLDRTILIALGVAAAAITFAIVYSLRKVPPKKKKPTRPPPIKVPESPSGKVAAAKPKKIGTTVAMNTNFEMDEFTLRMYKSGFIVDKIADGTSKVRCIMINESCEFCMFRDMKSLLTSSNNSALLKPYVKISLKDLTDCFQCTGELDRNIILKFKNRSIHFKMFCALDAIYLTNGFQAIISRLKYDKYYPQLLKESLKSEPSKYSQEARLRAICSNNAVMTHHFPGNGTVNDDDDGGSVLTAKTTPNSSNKSGGLTPQK